VLSFELDGINVKSSQRLVKLTNFTARRPNEKINLTKTLINDYIKNKKTHNVNILILLSP